MTIRNRQNRILKGFYDDVAKHRGGLYDKPGGLAEKFQEFVLRQVVGALKSRGWLLDVGCGRGRYFVPLASQGFIYVGLDSSIEMLKIAKSNANKITGTSFFFVQGSAGHIPFVDSFFDSVICVDVLHHFIGKDSRKRVIGELTRVLKSNGKIVIEIKNKLNLIYWLLSKTNPSHVVQTSTPFEARFFLRAFGCSNIRARGVMFPSSTLSPLVIFEASRQNSGKERTRLPLMVARSFER